MMTCFYDQRIHGLLIPSKSVSKLIDFLYGRRGRKNAGNGKKIRFNNLHESMKSSAGKSQSKPGNLLFTRCPIISTYSRATNFFQELPKEMGVGLTWSHSEAWLVETRWSENTNFLSRSVELASSICSWILIQSCRPVSPMETARQSEQDSSLWESKGFLRLQKSLAIVMKLWEAERKLWGLRTL